MLQNRIEALREARKNGEGGFTLIELLIVIVVLGILAGIVVFGVGSFRTDSEAAACAANAKTANVAASAYNASRTGAALLTGTADAQLDTLVGAKYMETKPTGLSLDAAGKFKC